MNKLRDFRSNSIKKLKQIVKCLNFNKIIKAKYNLSVIIVIVIIIFICTNIAWDKRIKVNYFFREVKQKITWLTDFKKPIIFAVNVSGISEYNAKITWKTNELTKTKFYLGTDTDYTLWQESFGRMAYDHSLNEMPNLNPGVTYYFRIVAIDRRGNKTEYSNHTFSKIVVDGNKHIYKNQVLDIQKLEKELQNLQTLSPRASWLTTTQRLRPEAKSAVEKLIAHAETDDMCLVVASSYRNTRQQQLIYNSIQDKTLVAQPGSSEHHTGLAVDFAACPMRNGQRNDEIERLELRNEFNTLPEYVWLTLNASKYNFEQSFRKDNKEETGYQEESWHWKYIIVN